MAVFDDRRRGVEATLAARRRWRGWRSGGHARGCGRACTRGRPRKVGRDYFGVEGIVAARVAEAAG